MALPMQQAAGAYLGLRAGEGGLEGLDYRCLECLVLEQVLIDHVRRPSAVVLDVFKRNVSLEVERSTSMP